MVNTGPNCTNKLDNTNLNLSNIDRITSKLNLNLSNTTQLQCNTSSLTKPNSSNLHPPHTDSSHLANLRSAELQTVSLTASTKLKNDEAEWNFIKIDLIS